MIKIGDLIGFYSNLPFIGLVIETLDDSYMIYTLANLDKIGYIRKSIIFKSFKHGQETNIYKLFE